MLAAVFLLPRAFAEDFTTVVVRNYYEISGQTGRELKQQMAELGPKRFWAYTRWHISWTGDCTVSLDVTYTLPRLTNRNKVPLQLRDRWDEMLAKLIVHEEAHGQQGRNAASEIVAADCEGANQIIQKWYARSKAYDLETGHGVMEGITLED